MAISAAPTSSNIAASLRAFLTAVLPADVVVVAGEPNRVPEVDAARFVIMSPPRFTRLSTNVDAYTDSKFTAAIAGTLLTVSAFDPNLNGAIVVGSTIFGNSLAANTTVTALGTGIGGVGTYTVTPSQNVPSQIMSAGIESLTQDMTATIQLDFHATDDTAGDLANIVSTLLRDEFGVTQFANQSPFYGVTPLHADDARQVPFYNAEQQVEWRWVVEALLQAHVVVSVPQQFADSLAVTLNDVQ